MRFALCCTFVAVLALVSAASSGQERPSHVVGQQRPSDVEVAGWVREALAGDPQVDASGVEIACVRGIVTLRGAVPTLAGKRYGILSAQMVHGVIGVVDSR